ncbi:CBS domain-containing protein [Balamuthia mandrillaris]
MRRAFHVQSMLSVGPLPRAQTLARTSSSRALFLGVNAFAPHRSYHSSVWPFVQQQQQQTQQRQPSAPEEAAAAAGANTKRPTPTAADAVRSFDATGSPTQPARHATPIDSPEYTKQVVEEVEQSRPTREQVVDDLVAFRDVTVGDIVEEKTHSKSLINHLVFVNEEDSVYHAIEKMRDERVGALLVRNSNGDFTGIFTERDYLLKIALKGLKSKETPIRQVMTRDFVSVTCNKGAMECMRLMTTKRFRHLPVVKTDNPKEVIGVISIGDLVQNVVREFKETLIYYQEFINGKYTK